MAGADNIHSRVVAGMKVLLPLVALGLLSTLFLISNTVDPSQSVSTSDIDLEKRARELGATNPSFAGVTRQGDEIRFDARIVRPDPDTPKRLTADRVEAQFRLDAGTRVDVTARAAEFDQDALTAQLHGDVRMTTSTGYVIETARLISRLDALHVLSPGTVTATGPLGELTAGRMLLHNAARDAVGDGAAELLFSAGVKLVYRPKAVGD
ncbi:hypothetical protein [Roseovarius sp. D22-M7]|uniref:hypothetical protein n=1 Tax=Roseovarius sp. D22-M7 TaxID=3127116 RepID=UPI0030105382